MDNDNGTPGGDGQKPAKRKRATTARKTTPSARKRSAKSVNAGEQSGIAAAESEPRETPRPQSQADGQEAGARDAASAISTPRAADQGDPAGDADRSGDDFRNGDADRAADLAADLKSWMDARHGERGEVL